MNDVGFLQRGGLWVIAQNALTLAVVVLSPSLGGHWRNVATVVIGVLWLVIGAWFGLAGVRALGRNRSPYPKPLVQSALIRDGIYARVRHPLYSSLMFVSLGWALIWGSWAGLIAAGALVVVLHGKAVREEQWLRRRYPEYLEYEQQVKRFVPGLL